MSQMGLIPHITVGFLFPTSLWVFFLLSPSAPSFTHFTSSLPHFLTPSLTPSHFIVGTPSLTPSLSHTPSWAAPEEPKRHYTPLNSLWKGVLDAVRARARARKGPRTLGRLRKTLNALSGRLCWMRRAREGPRALGRLRKSLNATKRCLWKALLDATRSQSSGAAPEEPKRH